jgi:hypothetical protein
MRGLLLLVVIGLAGAVWYQQIEMKRHHVKTNPARTLSQMGEELGESASDAASRISKDATRGVEDMTQTLGKKFGHIMTESTVAKESGADSKRRRR